MRGLDLWPMAHDSEHLLTRGEGAPEDDVAWELHSTGCQFCHLGKPQPSTCVMRARPAGTIGAGELHAFQLRQTFKFHRHCNA